MAALLHQLPRTLPALPAESTNASETASNFAKCLQIPLRTNEQHLAQTQRRSKSPHSTALDLPQSSHSPRMAGTLMRTRRAEYSPARFANGLRNVRSEPKVTNAALFTYVVSSSKRNSGQWTTMPYFWRGFLSLLARNRRLTCHTSSISRAIFQVA